MNTKFFFSSCRHINAFSDIGIGQQLHQCLMYLPKCSVWSSEYSLSIAREPRRRKSASLLMMELNCVPLPLKSNSMTCRSKCTMPMVLVFNSRRSTSECTISMWFSEAEVPKTKI